MDHLRSGIVTNSNFLPDNPGQNSGQGDSSYQMAHWSGQLFIGGQVLESVEQIRMAITLNDGSFIGLLDELEQNLKRKLCELTKRINEIK